MTETPRFLSLVMVSALACASGSQTASAHAFLDHATPSVGSSVSVAPDALTLTFSEGVVPALSGVVLSGPGGKAIALPKPTPTGADTLQVRLPGRLSAGLYVVTWHVVSVDTHRTSGSYKFTIGAKP